MLHEVLMLVRIDFHFHRLGLKRNHQPANCQPSNGSKLYSFWSQEEQQELGR